MLLQSSEKVIFVVFILIFDLRVLFGFLDFTNVGQNLGIAKEKRCFFVPFVL